MHNTQGFNWITFTPFGPNLDYISQTNLQKRKSKQINGNLIFQHSLGQCHSELNRLMEKLASDLLDFSLKSHQHLEVEVSTVVFIMKKIHSNNAKIGL